MLSPAAAFNTAREDLIRNASGLAAAMGLAVVRLYVEPEEDAPLPYILHGEDDIDVTGDDDCGHEAEVTATVKWWSKAKGTQALDKGAQARAIGAILVDVLVDDFAVTGWVIHEAELLSEGYSTDPDQSTRGRLVVRYLLTQAIESEA